MLRRDLQQQNYFPLLSSESEDGIDFIENGQSHTSKKKQLVLNAKLIAKH